MNQFFTQNQKRWWWRWKHEVNLQHFMSANNIKFFNESHQHFMTFYRFYLILSSYKILWKLLFKIWLIEKFLSKFHRKLYYWCYKVMNRKTMPIKLPCKYQMYFQKIPIHSDTDINTKAFIRDKILKQLIINSLSANFIHISQTTYLLTRKWNKKS